MTEFDALAQVCSYLSTSEVEAIHKAYLFADQAHQSQSRLSGERYIIHPLAVAIIVAEMHMDKESIIAALLHDVIEDTPYKKGDIKKKFGIEVAKLVDGLSKLTQIKFESHAQTQAENFRKLILAMAQDIRVILIKLADRLHNARTLEHHHSQKRRRIARETLEIYAPIANRLGIYIFRVEFEELIFFQLYPRRARILKEVVAKNREKRQRIIDDIIKRMQDSLEKANMSGARIYPKPRTLYSVYQEMKERRSRLSELEEIYQFQIVVEKKEECYLVLGLLHHLYKPIPDQFKDYIAIPKLNGYQALHTVLFGPYGLPLRVQIQTESMHKIAEYGIATYWLQQSDKTTADRAKERVQEWMATLLEMQKNTVSSLEFVEHVKNDLFPDEIYVFTPKGDILELPGCATPVDFAYAIHTDVGNSCVAAKIDKRLSSLSTILKNGQTIEIVRSKTASPNPDWLNFVVTGKARSGIRSALKNQKHIQTASLGKFLVDKSLSDLGSRLRKVPKENIKKLLISLSLKNLKSLFLEIGLGNQLAPIIAKKLVQQNTFELAANQDQGKPLQIKGTEDVAIHFSACCYPVPKEPIEGVLSYGRGLVVHHASCKNLVKERLHPEKCIPLSWAEKVGGEFLTELRVDLLNQKGSLARLALAIAESEANIDDIKVVEEHGGTCVVLQVIILVQNTEHLDRIIRNIQQLNVVNQVIRHQNI